MKHYNFIIIGKVQGVWYRGSAKLQANRLGLKGFVCNKPDGSVYLEAEGTDEALEALLAWCRQGPEFAHVEQVLVEEGVWRGFAQFEVLR